MDPAGIDMIERLTLDNPNGSETSQREAACLTLSRLLLCSLAAAPRWRHPPVACASLRHTLGIPNGALTVTEFVIPAKQGPALHTHLREDEVWYILEGDFRFKAGDEMLRVSTGGMAFGPRGTPHTFQNVGDTSGRLLVITTPSGLERFFEQFAELPPGQVDPQMIAALGHANWVEFIGPPLAVSDPL
jgi:mannose-6-phosphate isomerase-like protein (cupin superfamily)